MDGIDGSFGVPQRPAELSPALGRTPLPGSGYPGDSTRRWRPALPGLPGLRRQPAEPDSPVRRRRRWVRAAGNLLWVGAVVGWYLLSGGGGESEGGFAVDPITTGAGKISFGTGIDEADGSVTGEASVFHPGDSIAWSASLAESTEATELRLRVSQVANNDKSVETVTFEIEEGMADVIWPAEEMRVTRDMVGLWTLEVLHGDEVLATGSFTVRAR